MALRCGIVGLPNVGKSTLFNALTSGEAAAENYPFCTIDPNVGVVGLDDPRLARLAEVSASARTVPATVEFTDIAGLVKGASGGEGLGNRFLAHIRETDGIVHVVRCFEDPDVAHVHGAVDPVADAEVVNIELALADLRTVEGALERARGRARAGDADARQALGTLEALRDALGAGRLPRPPAPDAAAAARGLCLLTAKPALYVANAPDGEAAPLAARLRALAQEEGAGFVALDARLEAEIAALDPGSRAEFLADGGLGEPGLARLARAAFDLLGLQVFFTSGPKESRAWVIPAGSTAREAAAAIHTDMARGFICAEVAAHADFVAAGGEAGARAAGKVRREGRDHPLDDGDVVRFRFNV